MLKYALASIASAGVLTIAGCQDAAMIGDNKVPTDLRCEEDEMIGYNPDTPYNGIECLHEDIIINRYQEQQAG